MGSVYGDPPVAQGRSSGGGGGGGGGPDIYALAARALTGERRAELFSFAAASLLELGVPERLALLQSTDTAARLQFVDAAVRPFLAQLLARVSVSRAVGGETQPPHSV